MRGDSWMIDEPMTAAESTPLDGDHDTIGPTVPWFFQDDEEPGLRAQAGWAERHLGLSDHFFAQFLRVPEPMFREWKLGRAELPADRQDALRELWRTVLHLLSLMGMDERRISGLMERQIPLVNEWGYRHPHAPPWSGSALRSYLEERGADALPDVDDWVTGFRFGNPYAR
jgi:hypothetical protein